MMTRVDDRALRDASIEWLRDRTRDGLLTVDYTELSQDFTFAGERRPLKNRMGGIHTSRGSGAAWTITTTYRPDGKERPYDDQLGADGLLRYKWQGIDPENRNNKALRIAMERHLPLIWFWGVAEGVFKAVFPVYLVAEERHKHQFVVMTDGFQNLESTGEGPSDLVKSYRAEMVKKRVHQPVFRARVVQAYKTQCAICGMPRAELLDAAHIIPDKEPDGIASVSNGMALCKIHHAAYDADLLGVTPQYTVVLRDDVLAETDGPVHEYGLKGAHGHQLRVLPSKKAQRPDEGLLSQRYSKFLAAPRPRSVPVDWGYPPEGQR